MYTQREPASLQIELDGIGLDEYDRLLITGAADLGGTLDVQLLGAYTPNSGDSYEIVSAQGGFTRKFDIEDLPALPVGLSWNVDYSLTLLTLEVFGVLDGSPKSPNAT